jgi:hypothetical protein
MRSALTIGGAGIVAAGLLAAPLPVLGQTIDHLSALGPYLGDCVNRKLSAAGTRHAGRREVTFTLSFRADGTLFGEPRRSYSFPDASGQEQQLFITETAAAIVSCAPLPFSKALGGAMAGRIYRFQYRLQPSQELRA